MYTGGNRLILLLGCKNVLPFKKKKRRMTVRSEPEAQKQKTKA